SSRHRCSTSEKNRSSWSLTRPEPLMPEGPRRRIGRDRKSTRLNSSHVKISYAVFCLKKKKQKNRVKYDEYKEYFAIRLIIKVYCLSGTSSFDFVATILIKSMHKFTSKIIYTRKRWN